MARKILLADDSVTAQNMGRKILADAGYEVITVNNGSAALKRVAEQKPDVVILDVYMPGYSGLEVCQRLKEAAETARIPILLTVGKLEPFKPEEAKRARADGFIVKPFEASELLSALSKLEDKIVPRPEPSKPGRFARAFAAAEQADRPSKSEAGNKESGWKDRIAFPSNKSKSAQDSEDDSENYNADLRSSADKDGKRKRKEDSKSSQSKVAVSAIAPAGLPQDVTPEEIAAITAAAAQVQTKSSATESESSSEAGKTASPEAISVNSEHKTDEQKIDTAAPDAPQSAAAETLGATLASQGSEETTEAAHAIVDKERDEGNVNDKHTADRIRGAGNDAEVMAAIAALEPANGKAWDSVSSDHVSDKVSEGVSEGASESAATPETAGNGTGSRWMAVPVTLHANEGAISLEHEMQKAYAAFAAAEGAAAAIVAPVTSGIDERPEAAVSDEKVNTPDTIVEASVSPVAVEPALTAETASQLADVPPVTALEAVPDNAQRLNTQPTIESTTPTAPETSQTAETALLLPASERVAAQEPQGDSASPLAQEVTGTNAFEPATVPDLASAVAEVTSGWNNSEADKPQETAPQEAVTKDSEIAATTAAAWASWRQIRDTDTKATPEADQAKEFAGEPPATEQEPAAMAAAAGAEKSPEETSPTTSTESNNIASIVDSVMAELRPKIVAEISKKLAAEKK